LAFWFFSMIPSESDDAESDGFTVALLISAAVAASVLAAASAYFIGGGRTRLAAEIFMFQAACAILLLVSVAAAARSAAELEILALAVGCEVSGLAALMLSRKADAARESA